MEINLFPKFLDEAATPVAKSVGNTLSSIWSIVFGGIDTYAEKSQIKRVQALNQFKEELEQKVFSVPVENLVEPPLHIIGPTLEASKFYFESEDLRSMFVNLITATINNETTSKAHPSFVEIIKQLSPLDAKNLVCFRDKNTFPLATFRMNTNGEKGGLDVRTNVFLENQEVKDLNLIASSITNLKRLGMLDINHNSRLTDDGLYSKFEDLFEYKYMKDFFEEFSSENGSLVELELIKGNVTLTPFGKDFIDICLL